MLFAGRTYDDIPGADFPFTASSALDPTAAGSYDQPLSERMSMPRGARAGLEGY
jgi:hypothetical protein